jgi:four helix bundle suffix protein
MKPRARDKDLKDLKDIRDARNARRGNLGRFRPLSPSQRDKGATGGFIPPHGGYEDLLSFQKARIVFDGTVRFCERFLRKSDRTYDQMVQAARSGKQNILEGSEASGTSKETEIKLTCYLLDQQIRRLEQDFLKEGGLRERMTRARLAQRARQSYNPPNP